MGAPATPAVTGGRLITLDPAFPAADTLLVQQDRIVQVGDSRALRQDLGAAGEVFDLKGQTCLPGFLDPQACRIRAAGGRRVGLAVVSGKVGFSAD